MPNGGYSASCLVAAGSAHLSPRGQPDALTAHFEFPGRAEAGPAIVVVEEVKLGRQITILHLTLWQGGFVNSAPWTTPSVSRSALLAYATYTNMSERKGVSVPTGYEASPAAALPPLIDTKAILETGVDEHWEEEPIATSPNMKSQRRWRFCLPRGEPLSPGLLDMWVSLRSGENITQNILPYLLDSGPLSYHAFIVAPSSPTSSSDSQATTDDQPEARKSIVRKSPFEDRNSLWFPTIVMNMEVKKLLPKEGVQWVHVQVTSKQVKDGKSDMEFVVRDTSGEIIALSQHVSMIVSMKKNLKDRDAAAKASL